MKKLNYQTGKIGEQIAKDYLIRKGYQIIESNFRTRFGEIDLIASINQKLIFVEVKLKIGDDFGSPEEMINRSKLQQIQQMSQYFLQTHPELATAYPSYQIAAVCLVLNFDKSIRRIDYYEIP